MANSVLLADGDYPRLRNESREALRRLGIPSNIGFSDTNILDGLTRALGIEGHSMEEGEWLDYAGEVFRDALGEVLGLELPPATEDVVRGLRGLRLEL